MPYGHLIMNLTSRWDIETSSLNLDLVKGVSSPNLQLVGEILVNQIDNWAFGFIDNWAFGFLSTKV